VYRCRAPYLAVCGAAQALSLGWVQVPVVAVHLEGDSSYIDVPRITSADSNRIGISYASFEAGREDGQLGFSGYETSGARGRWHTLNGGPGEYRPTSSLWARLNCTRPSFRKERRRRYSPSHTIQCNYSYKEFSRAALRGMTESEVAKTVLKTCADSVPRYWRDRFHRDYDDRNTGRDIINLYLLAVSAAVIGAVKGIADGTKAIAKTAEQQSAVI
jgi:hypothetical protein